MNTINAIKRLNSHLIRHSPKKFHSAEKVKDLIRTYCAKAFESQGTTLEDLKRISSAELKRTGDDKPYLYFANVGRGWTANLQEVGETGNYKFASAYEGQPYSAWNK